MGWTQIWEAITSWVPVSTLAMEALLYQCKGSTVASPSPSIPVPTSPLLASLRPHAYHMPGSACSRKGETLSSSGMAEARALRSLCDSVKRSERKWEG